MLSRLEALLLRPDMFFKEVTSVRGDLIPPFFIVGAGGAAALGMGAIRILFFGTYPGMTLPLIALSILQDLAFPYLAWGFFSGLLYAFAHLFSGKGSFLATLQNVGYGLLPVTLSNLVGLVVVILFSGIPQLIHAGPWYPLVVSSFIYLIFSVWTCCLWVYGIKHSHGISQRKAIGPVLLLAAVYILAIYTSAYWDILLWVPGV